MFKKIENLKNSKTESKTCKDYKNFLVKCFEQDKTQRFQTDMEPK